MDDRVFLRVPVAEVADDGLHVGVVEQLHDLADAQLVEVDARPARLAAPPADLEEGLHQLAQERVGAHVGGEVVGRLLVRVGDARREQAVGDGLRVHVGEAVGVEVVDQRLLERLHQLGERARLGLDGERGLDAVADGARQLGQPDRELLRGGDDLAVAQGEGRAPALAPRLDVGVVVGPGELLASAPRRRRRGAARVSRLSQPSTLRVGRSWPSCGLREVGEADLALVALAVVGDEEQVVRRPGGALGAVGGGALLERHPAQDAAQRDDREPLRLELDEEDAPGLVRRERAQPLDLLDLGRVLRRRCRAPRACSRRSAPRSRPSSIGQPISSRR